MFFFTKKESFLMINYLNQQTRFPKDAFSGYNYFVFDTKSQEIFGSENKRMSITIKP